MLYLVKISNTLKNMNNLDLCKKNTVLHCNVLK